MRGDFCQGLKRKQESGVANLQQIPRLTTNSEAAFALTATVRYPDEKKGQQENIKHQELSHISLFPNAIFALNAISYITLYDT